MKDYQRLTTKRETPLVMSQWSGNSDSLRIYNRLVELENMIEDGQLGNVEMCERKIEELNARLANAIELKAKVGDRVYIPTFYKGRWVIREEEILRIEYAYTRDIWYHTSNRDYTSVIDRMLREEMPSFFLTYQFGKSIFTDKDEAKQWINEKMENSTRAKNLSKQGYKYLTRDPNGDLVAWRHCPHKEVIRRTGREEDYELEMWNAVEENYLELNPEFFKFVKWEDEKPTLIADIIHGGRI